MKCWPCSLRLQGVPRAAVLSRRLCFTAAPLNVRIETGKLRAVCCASHQVPRLPQVARGHAEQGGGAKKTLAGAVAMMRDLGNTGLALISGGRVEDGEESPDYLRVPYPPHFVPGFAPIPAPPASLHLMQAGVSL